MNEVDDSLPCLFQYPREDTILTVPYQPIAAGIGPDLQGRRVTTFALVRTVA